MKRHIFQRLVLLQCCHLWQRISLDHFPRCLNSKTPSLLSLYLKLGKGYSKPTRAFSTKTPVWIKLYHPCSIQVCVHLCVWVFRIFPDLLQPWTASLLPLSAPRPVSPNNMVIKWELLVKKLQRYTFLIELQGSGKECRTQPVFLSLLLVEAERNNTGENE